MKRKLRIGLAVSVAVVLLAVFTAPALAHWVGSLRADVRVDEPILVIQGMTPIPEAIYPGETFGFSGEIINTSSATTYGIRFHGFLWFWWMLQGEEVATEIVLEELPDSGRVNLPAAGSSPDPYLGTVEVYVNGSHLPPGSVFNIGPGQTYEVLVVVTTSYAAPVGRLTAEVFATRQSPVR